MAGAIRRGRDTWAKLREREEAIQHTCRPYIADIYKALIATVDQYGMAVSLLLGAKKFDIDEHGYVKIEPPGIAEACERSRKQIMSLVARLMDPCLAPRFEEVFRFEVAASVSEKKSLIHRRTLDVNMEGEEILELKNERWQVSDWNYDRIIYSLCLETPVKASKADLADLNNTLRVTLEHAMTDLRRACAREGIDARSNGSHLMSLGYALAPLECAPRRTRFARLEDLQYLVSGIKDLLCQGRKARAGRRDGSVATTYEGFGAVIEESLKWIERVFGLAPEGTAMDIVITEQSAPDPVDTNVE
jgi:hypothetical protein